MGRYLKTFPFVAIALWLGLCAPAVGQTVIVTTCGSMGFTWVAGQTGRPLTMDINGNLCGASTISGTVTAANPVGTTPTDRTVTSATGASQTLMAANASRHSLQVVNTGNANCGVNPTGGTAAIGGAGTITLVPFGSYSPRIPSLSAITAICTAAQPLYADEN